MSSLVGYFEYANRVKISWSKGENIHTVKRHEQLDYEEGCFENMEPEVLTTLDPLVARNTFNSWVGVFVN